MNADSRERNTKASLNGRFCEEFAKRTVLGLEWVGKTCDFVVGDMPGDVKGCEAWYPRYDMPNAVRKAGMMTLEPGQDAELKAKNGVYFCVVHIGELVIKSFFVPAVKVPSRKQISWTTMQKLAEVV